MQRSMNILLVEDNALDVLVFQRTMKKVDDTARIVHAENGIEALEIVNRTHSDKSIDSPYFILLDINMPLMDGHEFLGKLRSGSADTTAMVFVFSTSASHQDVQAAYENGANGYLVKPSSKDAMDHVLRTIKGYWTVCEPPLTPA